MEHGGGEIEGDGTVRFDLRIVPALSDFVFHREHIVGKNFAETEFAFVRRFLFQHVCLNEFHTVYLSVNLRRFHAPLFFYPIIPRPPAFVNNL